MMQSYTTVKKNHTSQLSNNNKYGFLNYIRPRLCHVTTGAPTLAVKSLQRVWLTPHFSLCLLRILGVRS